MMKAFVFPEILCVKISSEAVANDAENISGIPDGMENSDTIGW